MTSSRLSALLGDLNPIYVLIIGVIIGLGITSAACSQDATTEGSPTVEATPTKDVFVAQTGRGRPTPTSQPDRDSRSDRERGSRSDRERGSRSGDPTPTPTPMEEASPTSGFGNNDNSHGNHGDDWMFDRGSGVNAPAGNTLFGGPGNDHIVGGENSDDIYGGAGDDWVWGRGGEDYLVGGDWGGMTIGF